MFGDDVRRYRLRLGLSQERLAERAGVSVRGLRKIEAGLIDRPRPDTVQCLAQALGLDSADRDRFCQSALSRGADQPSTGSVPAQLPADLAAFAGRVACLDRLATLLKDRGPRPTAVLITTISGTAGVGKTALAVHWAHQVRRRFPDGQLYVNLRGFDPTGTAMTPAEAIRAFLDALNVSVQHIPADLDAQAGLYRSLLAGKRMLILLDNARDAEQVRLLLPGAPGCLVVVTSRDQLSGLIAAEGAQPLTLDLLTSDEARQLLTTRLGEDRVAGEPQAVETIITRCARLPLALAIVAARATAHPSFPLSAFADELGDSLARLDALASGDPIVDARAVFCWSFQSLTDEAAALFRRLGLHAGPDISIPAAASLIDLPMLRVRSLLAELARAHLVVEHTPGRYTFHDLLRAYATEQAHTHDTAEERRAATGHMLEHYLSCAADATNVVHPAAQHRLLRIPAPATPSSLVADRSAAQAWLDAERANLVAACGYAAGHGWAAHSIDLARVLTGYLDIGGHYADAFTVNAHARNASRRTGDRVGEAHAVTGLGLVHLRRGELGLAAEQVQQGLALARQVGDRFTEARALTVLGTVHWVRGELGPAAEHLQHALTLCRQVGTRAQEASARTILGTVFLRRGEFGPAAEQVQQGLALARQVGDRFTEARALTVLGTVHWVRGELGPAAEHLQHALTLCRQVGTRAQEASALTILGAVFMRRGEFGPAAEHLEQGLILSRQVGNRAGEASALTILGTVFLQRGEFGPAAEHLHHALTLSRQVANRVAEVWALTFLGAVLFRRGEFGPAAEHLEQGLVLSRQVGTRATAASALTILGLLDGREARHDRAAEHLQQALALSRQVGDRATEADVLTALGLVCGQRGEPEAAIEHLQHALTMYRRLGARVGEPDALNGLGEVLAATGAAHESHIQHSHALATAIEIGHRGEQARAHEGIANAHHATADIDQAGQHWQHALTLYTLLDLPDAKRVRNKIDGLQAPSPMPELMRF